MFPACILVIAFLRWQHLSATLGASRSVRVPIVEPSGGATPPAADLEALPGRPGGLWWLLRRSTCVGCLH